MSDEIVNKVANSGLITIDLKEYYPTGERVLLDIRHWLVQDMLLRETDFRNHLSQHDWTQYKDKFVAVTCSSDAIIPTWAYMLLALQLEPYAKKTVFGNLEKLESVVMEEAFTKIDFSTFQDAKIVIKGCGELPIPVHAYSSFVARLKPYAKSLMFGEPCSTVPLYKAKKQG